MAVEINRETFVVNPKELSVTNKRQRELDRAAPDTGRLVELTGGNHKIEPAEGKNKRDITQAVRTIFEDILREVA